MSAVSITDIVKIVKKTWEAYQALRDAPEEYREFAREVETVNGEYNRLRSLWEHAIDGSVSHIIIAFSDDLSRNLSNFTPLLDDINRLVDEYRSLQYDIRRKRDILRQAKFAGKVLGPVRSKLQQHRQATAIILTQLDVQLNADTNQKSQQILTSQGAIAHGVTNTNTKLDGVHTKLDEFSKIIVPLLTRIIRDPQRRRSIIFEDAEDEILNDIEERSVAAGVNRRFLKDNRPQFKTHLTFEANKVEFDSVVRQVIDRKRSSGGKIRDSDGKIDLGLTKDVRREAIMAGITKTYLSDHSNELRTILESVANEPNLTELNDVEDDVQPWDSISTLVSRTTISENQSMGSGSKNEIIDVRSAETCLRSSSYEVSGNANQEKRQMQAHEPDPQTPGKKAYRAPYDETVSSPTLDRRSSSSVGDHFSYFGSSSSTPPTSPDQSYAKDYRPGFENQLDTPKILRPKEADRNLNRGDRSISRPSSSVEQYYSRSTAPQTSEESPHYRGLPDRRPPPRFIHPTPLPGFSTIGPPLGDSAQPTSTSALRLPQDYLYTARSYLGQWVLLRSCHTNSSFNVRGLARQMIGKSLTLSNVCFEENGRCLKHNQPHYVVNVAEYRDIVIADDLADPDFPPHLPQILAPIPTAEQSDLPSLPQMSLPVELEDTENLGDDQDLGLAEAIQDFQPFGTRFCTFLAGQTIEVLDHINREWWFGHNLDTGAEGRFPSKHVREMTEEESEGEEFDEDLASFLYDLDGPKMPIDFGEDDKRRILFVDDLNELRSVAAHVCLARLKVELTSKGHAEDASMIDLIDSAGTWVGNGPSNMGEMNPNENLMQVIYGASRGSDPLARDLDERGSRGLDRADFYDFDFIVALDLRTYDEVLEIQRKFQIVDPQAFVTMLGYYVDNKGKRQWPGKSIDDPVSWGTLFKGEKGRIKDCYKNIDKHMRHWVKDTYGLNYEI